MPADDLTSVDYDEQQFVLLDSAPADDRENDRVPKDDARQRQRIVARHIAALAEHQLQLKRLEELIAKP